MSNVIQNLTENVAVKRPFQTWVYGLSLTSSPTMMVDGGATPAVSIIFPGRGYASLASASPLIVCVHRYTPDTYNAHRYLICDGYVGFVVALALIADLRS